MATRISRETFDAIAAAWLDILDNIADGQALNTVCASYPFTRSAVYAYRRESPQVVRDQFHDAMKDSANAAIDDIILTISSDDRDPRHARNKLNALQWLAEKRDPDKYGQRVRADFNVKTIDLNKIIADANARLANHTPYIDSVATPVLALEALL